MAPKVYGTALRARLGNPGNQFYFFQQFRNNGGTFFDPKTMKALINNPIGVKTMQQILALTSAQPPGVNKLDAVSAWVTWLQGKSAMIYSWPPTGRMSENYSQRDKAFSFLPKSKIVGKVGYAVIPGKNGEHAGSYVKCVSADSKNAELAYLIAQWMTSPSVSLQRVMLPYTLRDPYRISHYKSPSVPEPLAGRQGVPDRAQQRREQRRHRHGHDGRRGLRQRARPRHDGACTRARTSGSGLDAAAKEWDAITNKLGVDCPARRLRASS